MKPKLFIIAGMAFAASIGTVSPQKNKKSELTADTGKVILYDTLSLQNNNFAQTVKVGLNKNVSDMAEIPTWLRVFGAVIALAYLAGFLHFVRKMTYTADPHLALFRIALISFVTLVGIYIIDVIGFLRYDLLTMQERSTLFEIIKDLILIIFAFYFGKESKNDLKE